MEDQIGPLPSTASRNPHVPCHRAQEASWPTSSGPGTTFYVGTLADGRIVTGDLLGGPVRVLLPGAWPVYDGTTLNANGIRELPDGSFVLNNSAVGGLWQVGRGSGEVQPFSLRRGPGLTGGDGLVIDGATLYDVRGRGPAEVSVLRIVGGEHGWVGTWKGALTDSSLDVPSTATVAGGWLWAVNARFGVSSPSTASYWVTRLPLRRV